MSNESRKKESGEERAGEVTLWLGQLQKGDRQTKDEAIRQLNNRFANILQASIRQQLGPLIRSKVGGSDVYQEIINSFFRRASEGEYELPNRDACLALFFEMIKNKTINELIFYGRGRRNVTREVAASQVGDEENGPAGVDQIPGKLLRDLEPIERPYRQNLPRIEPAENRGDSIFANKDLIELLTLGADQLETLEALEVYNTVKVHLDQKPPLGVIFDRVLAGYSNAEIADEIGKTEARVRQWMGEMRTRMREIGISPEFQDLLDLDAKEDTSRG